MMYARFDESPITVTEGLNGIVTVTVKDDVRKAWILPDSGYMTDTITVDGETVTLADDGTYTFAEGEHTMSVTFKPAAKLYTITATAGAGGAISPAGEVMVSEGANRAFTIVPNDGFMIADVKVDDKSVGMVTGYTFKAVGADHTIHATFTETTGNVYSITAAAGYGGSITPAGEILVNENEDRTFTMVPNYGYMITDVLVDGVSAGAVSAYTFSAVVADHSI
jgi:hypothetical protein